jgi:hypothetical protein
MTVKLRPQGEEDREREECLEVTADSLVTSIIWYKSLIRKDTMIVTSQHYRSTSWEEEICL